MSGPAPRKRFGQHFLSDQAVIQHIVLALSPEKGQHLVEIGPGQGALTTHVLKRVGQLDVVELDRDLIPQLQERCERLGVLTVFSADALTFDFASVKQDARQLRIFGNLPYNISTPLLFHLLTFAPIVSDMLFMLQKEVAERLAALPDSADYGRLSVMVQYFCSTELLFDVPPSAFYPPPKVQSSIIKLIPYKELPFPAQDFHLFELIVREAFGQRRKTIRNSLKKLIPAECWSALSIASDLRPEDLSVEDFVRLSNEVSKQ